MISVKRFELLRNWCFVATKQHFLNISLFRFNEIMCFGVSECFDETKHQVGTIDSSEKVKKRILGIFGSARRFPLALALPLRSPGPVGRTSSASATPSL